MAKLKKTYCCICGKEIYRLKVHKTAKCKECRKQINIERSKKRYRQKRKAMFKLTEEEKTILRQLNSYPVISGWYGTIGTSGPTTSYKIIEVNGKKRVKGAVWLEKWIKRQKK